MPNYVKDLLDKNEKKEDKSLINRLKKRLGAKDYKEDLPHKDEGLEDRPWDKVKTTKEKEELVDIDHNIPEVDAKEIPTNEAERLAKRNKKISDRVGGWSRGKRKK